MENESKRIIALIGPYLILLAPEKEAQSKVFLVLCVVFIINTKYVVILTHI